MKKEKELEYSRALVPIKKKIYIKLIVSLTIVISVVILVSCLVACQKETPNIDLRGDKTIAFLSDLY